MPSTTYYKLPEEKRMRIFQAAVNEFAQRNVEAANLANIITEAKIPRGSLYQYFADRDDLYIHVIETLRDKRAEYTESAYKMYKKEPFLVFFEELYIRDSEFMLKNPQQLDIGKHLYGYVSGVTHKLIQKYRNHYRGVFLIGIDYDIDRGIIRPDLDREILADLCVHLITDVFIYQNLYSILTYDDIRKRTREIMAILRDGIAAKRPESKGIK